MTLKSTLETGAAIVAKVAEVAVQIAKVLPVGAEVAEAINLGAQIANGLENNIPAIETAYADIQAAAAGGQPVSADQWTAWKADIENAHSDFLAAAAKVEAQPGE